MGKEDQDKVININPSGDSAKIRFDYIKSNLHREIHVEGVHGGLGPKGKIQMSVFTERNPIPKQIVHKLEEDGSLGDEALNERLTRDSIIRSVDATLIMDIETAKSIQSWMQKHIEKAEKIMEQLHKEKK